MQVEKDICRKDLFELDRKTIRLLSSDLNVFNDYAFRYYLLQFIYLYGISSEFVMEDMFIQAFFGSNLLNKNTQIFLQFESDEKEIIMEFLQKFITKFIQSQKTKQYKSLEAWEQEEVIVPFKSYEIEIKKAMELWSINK